jgi:hypothetical protein
MLQRSPAKIEKPLFKEGLYEDRSLSDRHKERRLPKEPAAEPPQGGEPGCLKYMPWQGEKSKTKKQKKPEFSGSAHSRPRMAR